MCHLIRGFVKFVASHTQWCRKEKAKAHRRTMTTPFDHRRFPLGQCCIQQRHHRMSLTTTRYATSQQQPTTNVVVHRLTTTRNSSHTLPTMMTMKMTMMMMLISKDDDREQKRFLLARGMTQERVKGPNSVCGHRPLQGTAGKPKNQRARERVPRRDPCLPVPYRKRLLAAGNERVNAWDWMRRP